ncbi:MAG TPA: antibiotic biosynthesis monooxygenase [Verrucomicrobiae bacterium]|nr:antibiotic biosynthesis monooxygenase [Verrucomicrobiae bacterium]
MSPPRIITIFRSRLRSENLHAYEAMAAQMLELAEKMPGFIAIKTFQAADGERVSIVEFESEETHNAWRIHPEHQEAQRLGRELFYSEFQLQVCKLERSYGMSPRRSP